MMRPIISDEDRPAVEERVAEIAEVAGGRPAPSILVEDARSETSPLHKYFDWCDATAAHAARLQVARQILQSIRITLVSRKQSYCIPAYLRDPDKGSNEEGYVTLPLVQSDAAMKTGVMLAELSRASSALRRASGIGKALGYKTPRIDEMAAEIDALAEQF